MKIAVISGGSSGIGEACVNKFLNNGYQVFNLDIKENVQLGQLANYLWIKTDVSVEEDIISAIGQINKIDTLIISAGVHLSATILNSTTENLTNLVNLNLFGAFWLIQKVLPLMIKANYGNIITIGSDQYTIAKPNSAIYGMTKAALAQLTKSIALDYAKHNILANCIGVGTIDTPLYRNAITNYSKRSGIDLADIELDENKEQPLGRIGMPEEVAELAWFLASGKAKFMTGAYIPLDGGYTIK